MNGTKKELVVGFQGLRFVDILDVGNSHCVGRGMKTRRGPMHGSSATSAERRERQGSEIWVLGSHLECNKKSKRWLSVQTTIKESCAGWTDEAERRCQMKDESTVEGCSHKKH